MKGLTVLLMGMSMLFFVPLVLADDDVGRKVKLPNSANYR